MTKPVKTMLVKAPEGFGYHLNQQVPKVYVTGRPYVVQNSTQVQTASARKSLIILGETDMTDEEFLAAYKKDPKVAIEEAVLDTEKSDPAAIQQAAKDAKAAKEAAAKVKKEEAARIKKEAAQAKAAKEAAAKVKKEEAARIKKEAAQAKAAKEAHAAAQAVKAAKDAEDQEGND